MITTRDAILEGVGSLDVDRLRALDAGRDSGNADHLARLEAKGWVETHGQVHLITLTGRTLLERAAHPAS